MNKYASDLKRKQMQQAQLLFVAHILLEMRILLQFFTWLFKKEEQVQNNVGAFYYNTEE